MQREEAALGQRWPCGRTRQAGRVQAHGGRHRRRRHRPVPSFHTAHAQRVAERRESGAAAAATAAQLAAPWPTASSVEREKGDSLLSQQDSPLAAPGRGKNTRGRQQPPQTHRRPRYATWALVREFVRRPHTPTTGPPGRERLCKMAAFAAVSPSNRHARPLSNGRRPGRGSTRAAVLWTMDGWAPRRAPRPRGTRLWGTLGGGSEARPGGRLAVDGLTGQTEPHRPHRRVGGDRDPQGGLHNLAFYLTTSGFPSVWASCGLTHDGDWVGGRRFSFGDTAASVEARRASWTTGVAGQRWSARTDKGWVGLESTWRWGAGHGWGTTTGQLAGVGGLLRCAAIRGPRLALRRPGIAAVTMRRQPARPG